MLALLVAAAILIPGYAVAKLNIENAPFFLLIVFCIFYSFEAAAQFNAVAFKNPLIGMMTFVNWWFVSFLFCGFLINPDDVIWPLRILTYIVPFNWGMKGMALVEFRDGEYNGTITANNTRGFDCPDVPVNQCYGRTGDQILESLSANFQVVDPGASLPLVYGILVAVAAFFKLGFFLLTWWRCR